MIAAITSCTNTSNPSVMVAAGLLAKKAVERGLETKPWVKASLAPGSKVVTDYLQRRRARHVPRPAPVQPGRLRLHDLHRQLGPAARRRSPRRSSEDDLVAVAVLSGNRNFEGRINPDVRANYLASPPLVVAYALAGTMDIDLQNEPLGTDRQGQPVFLKDIWPSQREIQDTILKSVRSEMFQTKYAEVFQGDERWSSLPVPAGRPLRVGRDVDVRQEPAVLPRHDGRAAAGRADREGAGAGGAGRQHHDRPHLAGRLDQAGQPGGPLPDRARRRASPTSTPTARGGATTR